MFAGKKRGRGQELAVITHRVFNRQVVALTDHIVFLAVTGGGMDGAGAGIECHVIADNQGHLAGIEGVLK